MSDFLTRLAERTLGHGHAVEPLLPSLWETAPVIEEGLPDASIGHASTTVATEISSAPGHAGLSSVQPAAVEVSPQAVTADAPTPPPLRPAARVEREEARPDVASPPLVRPTPPNLAPPSIVPATFETAVVREQIEHLERVEVHTTRAGVAVPDAATSREAGPREERASVVASAPAGLPAPLLPRVTERSEELRPLAAAVNAPASAPRVEITIGRIDVRATPKSGPVQKPQRPAAASHERLSLQDYLAAGTEKRGGGRP
ncbi:MAG: hypothetical protein M0R75_06445 [Dehalococcoidia bacterium]|nr:hypothetical protein [Dehalococcoidia bacterium]